MNEVTFKVESGLTPAKLQTKLNQWRHDYKVKVVKFVDNMQGNVSAIIELYPKEIVLPITLPALDQATTSDDDKLPWDD